MAVTGFVLSSIGKILLKTPAVYNCTEVLLKHFFNSNYFTELATVDVYVKESARRMIGAMSSNEACLGTNRTNPFRYKKTRVEYDHCVLKRSTFCKSSNIQQLTQKVVQPCFHTSFKCFQIWRSVGYE